MKTYEDFAKQRDEEQLIEMYDRERFAAAIKVFSGTLSEDLIEHLERKADEECERLERRRQNRMMANYRAMNIITQYGGRLTVTMDNCFHAQSVPTSKFWQAVQDILVAFWTEEQ